MKYLFRVKFWLKASGFLLIAIAVSACSQKKVNPLDPYEGDTAAVIYQKGKKHIEKNRFELAIKDFEALEAKYPYGEYSDKGQLALIYAYFKRNDKASTLAAADRFIRIHPRHPEVDYAHYMKGVVNYEEYFSTLYRYFPLDRSKRDTTQARQSFDDLKLLLEKYPNSAYAADARKRMVYLKNFLAEHEIHVAQYYLTQGAYLAAANRASHVVNQFDNTPAVPDALVIMAKSYRQLGMANLEQDALQVLEKNFSERVAEAKQ